MKRTLWEGGWAVMKRALKLSPAVSGHVIYTGSCRYGNGVGSAWTALFPLNSAPPHRGDVLYRTGFI